MTDVWSLVVLGACAALLGAVGGWLRRVLLDRLHALSLREVINVDAEAAQWRTERRKRRREELQAWDRDFAGLLPRPEPVPCDGSNHQHISNVRLGSNEIQVVCVLNARSSGGFVLAPGERVIRQREIADQLGRGGISVEDAMAAIQRLAL